MATVSATSTGSSASNADSVRNSGADAPAAGNKEGLACGGSRCFYCLAPCSQLRRGWKLHCGRFAALCFTCSSAYEDGSFCKIFHWRSDGWRDCATCKKSIHCGCIMASNVYVFLDAGGVQCTDCLRKEISKRSKDQLQAESASSQSSQN